MSGKPCLFEMRAGFSDFFDSHTSSLQLPLFASQFFRFIAAYGDIFESHSELMAGKERRKERTNSRYAHSHSLQGSKHADTAGSRST